MGLGLLGLGAGGSGVWGSGFWILRGSLTPGFGVQSFTILSLRMLGCRIGPKAFEGLGFRAFLSAVEHWPGGFEGWLLGLGGLSK